MQRQISPVTGTSTYSYDPAGNLTSATDANGGTTTRTYDAVNRVLTATSMKPGVLNETVTWVYDNSTSGNYGRGRVASMTDPSGSATYRYERRGLLTSEQKTIQAANYTTTFMYDAAGNRTRITLPSGRIVDYTFDYANRPFSAASGSTNVVISAAYAPFGPLTQLNYGNGTTKTMQYDARYRPSENKLTGPAGVIADYTYVEDAIGNITQLHDALNPAYNRDFTYDDLNRLIGASTGNALWGTGTYSYDPMGNLLSQQIGSVTTTFSHTGSTPKLSNVTAGANSQAVSYDSNGNEATIGSRSYAYTSRNSLSAADTFAYTYDGRGVRTITSTTGTVPAVDTVTLTPANLNAGDSATGSILLTAAAGTGGVVVSLASSDPTVASVPATVTIPEAATTATFAVSTSPVISTTSVTITAQLVTVRGAVLTVQPAVAGLSALSVTPASIPSPQSATGTVTLSSAAPVGGVSVAISTTNATVTTVPQNVTVNQGQTSASFEIKTKLVASPTSVTISATYSGTTKTAPLTVNPCTLSTVAPPSFPLGDVVWIDDSLPAGAVPTGWQWDTSQLASGTQSHVDSTITATISTTSRMRPTSWRSRLVTRSSHTFSSTRAIPRVKLCCSGPKTTSTGRRRIGAKTSFTQGGNVAWAIFRKRGFGCASRCR